MSTLEDVLGMEGERLRVAKEHSALLGKEVAHHAADSLFQVWRIVGLDDARGRKPKRADLSPEQQLGYDAGYATGEQNLADFDVQHKRMIASEVVGALLRRGEPVAPAVEVAIGIAERIIGQFPR